MVLSGGSACWVLLNARALVIFSLSRFSRHLSHFALYPDMHKRLLPLLVLTGLVSHAFADSCDSILPYMLHKLNYSSVETLDTEASQYYTSSTFQDDYRRSKVDFKIVVKGVPLGIGASDDEIKKWQEQIKSGSSSFLSSEARAFFSEQKGQVEIGKLWLDCMLSRLDILAEVKDHEADATVTFKVKEGSPAIAEIEGVFPLGAKQVTTNFTKGAKFGQAGITEQFKKNSSDEFPIVKIQTNIGTGFAILKPWIDVETEVQRLRARVTTLLEENRGLSIDLRTAQKALDETRKTVESLNLELVDRRKKMSDTGKVFRKDGRDIYMVVNGAKIYCKNPPSNYSLDPPTGRAEFYDYPDFYAEQRVGPPSSGPVQIDGWR